MGRSVGAQSHQNCKEQEHVELTNVLCHAFRVGGFWNHTPVSALDGPGQDDLTSRPLVRTRDGEDLGVGENRRVVLTES